MRILVYSLTAYRWHEMWFWREFNVNKYRQTDRQMPRQTGTHAHAVDGCAKWLWSMDDNNALTNRLCAWKWHSFYRLFWRCCVVAVLMEWLCGGDIGHPDSGWWGSDARCHPCCLRTITASAEIDQEFIVTLHSMQDIPFILSSWSR